MSTTNNETVAIIEINMSVSFELATSTKPELKKEVYRLRPESTGKKTDEKYRLKSKKSATLYNLKTGDAKASLQPGDKVLVKNDIITEVLETQGKKQFHIYQNTSSRGANVIGS